MGGEPGSLLGVARREKRPRLLFPGLLFLVVLVLGFGLFERILDSWVPLSTKDPYGASRLVLSREGVLLRVTPTKRGERRIVLPLEGFSPRLKDALIAAEDKHFFSHAGVDFGAIGRAAFSNLLAGKRVSGASTLSMQVCRLLEPRPRTFRSKLLELIRTRQLERRWSKERILCYYLNTAPLGGLLRGFEAASLYWFGVHARDLDLLQAATLVALLPAPSRRSPRRHPGRLVRMRNRVLGEMAAAGLLDPGKLEELRGRPLGARVHPWPFEAPLASRWFLRHMRGERLVTSLRWPLQRGLQALARRFDPGPGMGLGALVLDRKSGEVQAMLGTPDWNRTKVNPLFSKRCVGSTLKPFLYALALDLGVSSPVGLLPDRPRHFRDWNPKNFDQEFLSWVGFGQALRASRNLPAITLLDWVGTARFRDLLTQLGLSLPGNQLLGLDAALGTLSLSPFQLAQAYRSFADLGKQLPVSSRAREIILGILSRPRHRGLPLRPRISWKTGTSTGRRDAWSVGVTKGHVLLVWMGPLEGAGAPEFLGGKAPTDLLFEIASLFGEQG